MMRALAGVSAAAVALIALPTTVGAAAESASTSVSTSVAVATESSAPATTGLASFLAEPAIFGLNMGAFLWLAIALLAAVVAIIAVGRSRVDGLSAANNDNIAEISWFPTDVAQPGH
jgi:hypothetical protein